jgi:hypothetical protein
MRWELMGYDENPMILLELTGLKKRVGQAHSFQEDKFLLKHS